MYNRNDLEAVAQAIICPDNSEAMTLEYFLRKLTDPDGEIAYGLRVDKRQQKGVLVEREETTALTRSLADITAMAKAFAAGSVPPCVLIEMVDEWHEVMFEKA